MDKIKEYIMIGLASLITIGYFATLFYLIYEKSYESTINLTIGTLLTAFGTVVGYFFGSSKGSAEKNDLINK